METQSFDDKARTLHLERLRLVNFKGINCTEVSFDRNFTALAGINGTGKSTILRALQILLSWPAARIKSSKGNGREMDKSIEILRGASSAVLEVFAMDNSGHELSWRQVANRPGRTASDEKSDYHQLSAFAADVQERITRTEERCSIPLFVYYPVDRAGLDIPQRIRIHHEFPLLSAYDEALVSGANFRDFFEWFRDRQLTESQAFQEAASMSDFDGSKFVKDRQLSAVRDAVERMMPGFSGLKVQSSPNRMTIRKGAQELRIDDLSDGERCLLAMVGDLARRLSIANPTLPDPLGGFGVVLIDELDLHLHPAWQRRVVSGLVGTFPNCQFVVTTHSPQILSEVRPGQIRLLGVGKDGIDVRVPDQSFGLDSVRILQELMGDDGMNADVKKSLSKISDLIAEENFEQAKDEISKLEEKTSGETPDLVGLKATIFMLDPKGAPENSVP
jgi:predicted ATP-binding protein involved in virulence